MLFCLYNNHKAAEEKRRPSRPRIRAPRPPPPHMLALALHRRNQKAMAAEGRRQEMMANKRLAHSAHTDDYDDDQPARKITPSISVPDIHFLGVQQNQIQRRGSSKTPKDERRPTQWEIQGYQDLKKTTADVHRRRSKSKDKREGKEKGRDKANAGTSSGGHHHKRHKSGGKDGLAEPKHDKQRRGSGDAILESSHSKQRRGSAIPDLGRTMNAIPRRSVSYYPELEGGGLLDAYRNMKLL